MLLLSQHMITRDKVNQGIITLSNVIQNNIILDKIIQFKVTQGTYNYSGSDYPWEVKFLPVNFFTFCMFGLNLMGGISTYNVGSTAVDAATPPSRFYPPPPPLQDWLSKGGYSLLCQPYSQSPDNS